MKSKYVILLFSLIFLLASCSKPKIIRELPVGNLSRISPKESPNTKNDEVAPVQQPSNLNIVDPCQKEQSFVSNQPFRGIITSAEFIKRTFPASEYNKEAINYLTSNVESVTFLTANEGYASFSHPPHPKYIQRYGLPLEGSVGGTDIFYFYPKKERIIFEVLPPPVNSEFWDSHPFVTNDELGNQLLIWASDRLDNFGGYSFPYKNEGNTDLYFAFKRTNQDWKEVQVHNFNEVMDGINTKYSEATPFLFCKCYNPTLFFASNRDSKDSTFDLFYVKLEIDFINQKIQAKGQVEKLPAGNNDINTTADERFPFIAYPHFTNYNPSLELYFSSNRLKDSIVFVSKDSLRRETRLIIKNVGGYDLYRFELYGNKFECTPPPPPPPPKLYLIVHLNDFCYDSQGNPVDSALDISGKFLMNNSAYQSQNRIELALGTRYVLERISNDSRCSGACDSCFSSKIEFATPNKIFKDTTIEFSLNQHCYKKQPKRISFSYQKGLAFFVTGYWYPTTTRNLKTLYERSKSGCLVLSNFIDSTDFKPDEKYFYQTAAEINDKWFNEFLFPTIDSLLQALDTCYSNQEILITVHGYTDPCPLRTHRDPTGRITQDSTRYTCDDTVKFERNDFTIVIPPGIYMKQPNLKTTDGKTFTPPFGIQQGNYVLAMLRAHFTRKTIEEGFKAKYQNNSEKIRLFEKFVKFHLNAFGIYDERPPCPNIDKNIVGVELANQPYPPSLNEPCNLPHSRRVMIYLDVVDKETIQKKSFARGECGKLLYPTYVELKKEKEKVQKVPISLPSEEELFITMDTLELPSVEEYETPTETPCAGNCYRIVYGKARNAEEFYFLSNLLKSIGFEVEQIESNNLELVSKERFFTIEQARKTIEEFSKAINKLSPIIDISRIKAFVIQI